MHTPVDEMRALGKKALELIAALRALFPKLLRLTDEERRTSKGKLRAGEEDALRSILRVALKYPHLFESLAASDFGDDPTTFEGQLLLDRLDRREVLTQVASALRELTSEFDDTVLRVGELVRPAALDAYDIAGTIAEKNPTIRAMLQPALDFYGKMGRKAAQTKKARKAAPSATNGPALTH